MFAVVCAVSVTFVSVQKTKPEPSSLLARNIVAFAQSEGTSVGNCARRTAPNLGELSSRMFCDSQTDANTIYPCPTSPSSDYYLANNTDRCTK